MNEAFEEFEEHLRLNGYDFNLSPEKERITIAYILDRISELEKKIKEKS